MTDTATAVPPLRGDETTLYDQHAIPLTRAVRQAVNTSEATVEDACQFAWMQLLRRQPDREYVFGWLRTTAVREAWRVSARERRALSLDIALGEAGDAGTLADTIIGPDLQVTVDAREALRAVARLGPKPRYALARVIAGLSYEEIQREGDLSFRQVSRHLTKAREGLRV